MGVDDVGTAEPARLFGLVEDLTRERRVLLGITGAPGAGKSTLAAALVEEAEARGVGAVDVPMDGFHLTGDRLRERGSIGRRGAIDTFDGSGFVALVRRLRFETDVPVTAPSFDRSTEEPVPDAIHVPAGTRLVVVEGNYLLDDEPPWNELRDLLTRTWYLDVDPGVRREGLLARHVRFGRTPDGARDWMSRVDDPNAARIASGRHRADLVVRRA